jgi:hypothetical protein
VKLPLTAGAYSARGFIANAQTCENLFAEPNLKDSPFPATFYPASGLSVFADYTGIFTGRVRGLYWSSKGQFYAVIGTKLIMQTGRGVSYQLIGDVGDGAGNFTPVSMVDNGGYMMVVDGSANGWTVDLATQTFEPIDNDPATSVFYGSHRVDYMDTYFVLSRPGTQLLYLSQSNDATFDPLKDYSASKIGYNDVIQCCLAVHDNVWVIGTVTTEIWFNSGGSATFAMPFERMPNTVIQQGGVSPWGAVVAGNGVYWVSQDRHGRAVAMMGEGYQAKRISTFAIENEWAKYHDLTATFAMAYQQGGHEIVLFYFQNNHATWAYDITTGEWHRRTYGPDRDAWLPYCVANWGTLFDQGPGAQNLVIAGDRTGPRLLEISREVTTDCGIPIQRVRSWPHVMNDQKRLVHSQFVAALQPGQLNPDAVTLRWSDDGGQTWGQPLVQTVGNATNGQYSWRRLGMARDRVYELSWSAQGETALNGAWIEAVASTQ